MLADTVLSTGTALPVGFNMGPTVKVAAELQQASPGQLAVGDAERVTLSSL